MLSHIVRKLIGVIPILLLVSMILFTIISLLPGDAAMAVMGESLNQEDLIKTRSELGLDKPIYVRYADWLCKVLHGNLGRALKSNQPVTEIITQRLPVTVELTLLAVVISTAHRSSCRDLLGPSAQQHLGRSGRNYFNDRYSNAALLDGDTSHSVFFGLVGVVAVLRLCKLSSRIR